MVSLMADRRWPNETFLWGDKSLGISIYAKSDWGRGTRFTAYAWADGRKRDSGFSDRRRETVEQFVKRTGEGYETRIREWVADAAQ